MLDKKYEEIIDTIEEQDEQIIREFSGEIEESLAKNKSQCNELRKKAEKLIYKTFKKEV